MKPGKFGNSIVYSFTDERHIAPLVVLRIAFGAIMFISTIRFIMKGWVVDFYVNPKFHFTFYGFDWVKPFNETGMYLVFAVMAIAALGIMFGFFYRISSLAFFISFFYIELLDKTYYLNHYYFVTLISFLLLFVPANRYFSFDVRRNPSLNATHVPGWMINIFKLQLFIVYFFAGISKINYDWLIEAMPLKIWLPANQHLPVIGYWLGQTWVAYFFSWFGLVYDLSIGFLLLDHRTRKIAYITVIIFHVLTALLFKIGMFPYIMICVTIIFFSENFQLNLIRKIKALFRMNGSEVVSSHPERLISQRPWITVLLVSYFTLQLLVPFRYLLYPGKLFWTEEGYRFSWRVMLMEKGGTAFFYVEDVKTGRKFEAFNPGLLTSLQEKMMTTQPDMILQYAHFLDAEYRKKGMTDPIVTVQSYVTLNGAGSRLFIDSTVDLSAQKESFLPKSWILSPDKKIVKP